MPLYWKRAQSRLTQERPTSLISWVWPLTKPCIIYDLDFLVRFSFGVGFSFRTDLLCLTSQQTSHNSLLHCLNIYANVWAMCGKRIWNTWQLLWQCMTNIWAAMFDKYLSCNVWQMFEQQCMANIWAAMYGKCKTVLSVRRSWLPVRRAS